MADIVIFGTKDFAELAHFYLSHDSPHKIAAFTVDKEYLKEERFLKLPVVAFDTIEKEFTPDRYSMFIPMSPQKLNESRAKKYREAKTKGYTCISYISSKAIYYNTPVGENSFIFEQNVIQPFTKIGNNVIVWSGNHIGHHSIIGDHCFISSHVVISGHVVIGDYSFLGVNSTVRDGITVEKRNIIGAGALVMKSTKEGEVFPGNKSVAAKISSRELKDF